MVQSVRDKLILVENPPHLAGRKVQTFTYQDTLPVASAVPCHDRTNPLNISEGSRICLVGNSPELLDRPRGKIIDTFDEIVRFNLYRIGPEQFTGTKTTIWATHGRHKREDVPDRAIVTFPRKHLVKGTIWGVASCFYSKLARKITADVGKQMWPTAGLLTAAWLIEHDFDPIYIVGFSHFNKTKHGPHHYWQTGKWGSPKEHSGEWEESWFNDCVKAGEIVRL